MKIFKMLTTGFKDKIKRGEVVEIWHKQSNDVYTVSNGHVVDYVHRQDLEEVKGE